MNPIPRHSILGTRVSAINLPIALDAISTWIAAREPHYVCCVPAHTIMDCYDQPDLRPVINNAGLATPDGMAVVWLLHWAGFKQVSRVYGPDLLLAACQASLGAGYRHYFYGGRPEVVERLVQRLSGQFPGLRIAGCESPPFRSQTVEEEAETTRRIRAARPDILWVGIGSPRQEQWMAEHVGSLDVPVLVGVGAAFDFLSGAKPQAPRWVQRSGLEWFFRLASEPRRLWRRYLLGYPRFIYLVILQRLGLLKF